MVRGGGLDPEILAQDAQRAHDVYGAYAISAFAADGVTVDELAQEPPLVRFASMTLMTVSEIRAAGLLLLVAGFGMWPHQSISTQAQADHAVRPQGHTDVLTYPSEPTS